jgi:hypothetical protein
MRRKRQIREEKAHREQREGHIRYWLAEQSDGSIVLCYRNQDTECALFGAPFRGLLRVWRARRYAQRYFCPLVDRPIERSV